MAFTVGYPSASGSSSSSSKPAGPGILYPGGEASRQTQASKPTGVSSKPAPGLKLISDGTRSIYVPSSWLPMQSNPQYNTVVQSLLTKYVAPSSSSSSGGGGGPTYSPPKGGGGGSVVDNSVTINTPEQKKSNDKPQVDALKKMIDESFADQRDTKISNIDKVLSQAKADILKGYGERAGQLDLSREDNEKAESDASFANLLNRARERADVLEQTALNGAGESDTLRSTMMAIRNWDANQGDINRSYYDTMRSINSAITDLNGDTRTNLRNVYTQALGDKEQVWTDYYNQRTDAYTSLGNIRANPYSDQYKKGDKSFDLAAKETAKAWKNPGVPSSIQNWQGTVKAQEDYLNNSKAQTRVTNLAESKPEGATLRKW